MDEPGQLERGAPPPGLESACRMRDCAYPSKVPQSDYLPLLWLLKANTSFRQCAAAITHVYGGEYMDYLGDTYTIEGRYAGTEADIVRVRAKLEACGYAAWLREL